MGKLQASGNREFLKFFSPSEKWTDEDRAALKYLVLKFPYCQPLHFANASAVRAEGEEVYKNHLSKAALYASRRDVLYRFIHEPQYFQNNVDLSEETEEIRLPELSTSIRPAHHIETVTPESESMAVENAVPANDTLLPVEPVHADETEADAEENQSAEPETKDATPEIYIEEADNELEAEAEDELPEEESTPSEENDQQNNSITEEINSGPDPLHESIETVIPDAEHPEQEEKIVTENSADTRSTNLNAETTAEETEVNAENAEPSPKPVALESIAATDYFAFNRSSIDPLQAEADTKSDKESVTRYDDDSLPYSFLWWLHKTRKEYEATYQPYAPQSPAKRNSAPAQSTQLNQQIIENIFHIQPELNTMPLNASHPTVEFELKRKEDIIIEKFIKEEPQIKPPSAAKVDTENKARKSSEDKLDLVSETLAKIYTDQMLYDKAIETYRKLSLKYPDKSSYFASQIENLEKKIS